MKLSEKGLGKLYNSKACYYDPDTEEEVVALSYFEHVFEFDQDDFQGAVVLSLEEAKALLRRIPEFKESGGWQLPIERLKERITKAEMSIVSTQCENVSKKDEKIDIKQQDKEND